MTLTPRAHDHLDLLLTLLQTFRLCRYSRNEMSETCEVTIIVYVNVPQFLARGTPCINFCCDIDGLFFQKRIYWYDLIADGLPRVHERHPYHDVFWRSWSVGR